MIFRKHLCKFWYVFFYWAFYSNEATFFFWKESDETCWWSWQKIVQSPFSTHQLKRFYFIKGFHKNCSFYFLFFFIFPQSTQHQRMSSTAFHFFIVSTFLVAISTNLPVFAQERIDFFPIVCPSGSVNGTEIRESIANTRQPRIDIFYLTCKESKHVHFGRLPSQRCQGAEEKRHAKKWFDRYPFGKKYECTQEQKNSLPELIAQESFHFHAGKSVKVRSVLSKKGKERHLNLWLSCYIVPTTVRSTCAFDQNSTSSFPSSGQLYLLQVWVGVCTRPKSRSSCLSSCQGDKHMQEEGMRLPKHSISSLRHSQNRLQPRRQSEAETVLWKPSSWSSVLYILASSFTNGEGNFLKSSPSKYIARIYSTRKISSCSHLAFTTILYFAIVHNSHRNSPFSTGFTNCPHYLFRPKPNFSRSWSWFHFEVHMHISSRLSNLWRARGQAIDQLKKVF